MPILCTEREHCELRIGSNALGGDAPDSVLLPELANLPLVGAITVSEEGAPSIQRFSSRVALKLNGAMLGAAATALTEGAMIQVGTVRLTYHESFEAAAAAVPGLPSRRRESELATQVMSTQGAPVRPAALIALETGRITRLAGAYLVVGRSEDADIMLSGQRVSRRHAVLSAEGMGYALTDESTNGTYINGERVTGRTPLQAGDTIAFGDEHYRFDYIDATLAARAGTTSDARGAGTAPVAAALAELTVVSGRQKSTHAIHRPVCAIGSGTHNDVCIDDESISASHATLLLKGETWYLTDLRSASGTYVDGYRVAGERALVPGSVIRIGQITMAFWPTGARRPESGARARDGLLRRLSRTIFFGD